MLSQVLLAFSSPETLTAIRTFKKLHMFSKLVVEIAISMQALGGIIGAGAGRDFGPLHFVGFRDMEEKSWKSHLKHFHQFSSHIYFSIITFFVEENICFNPS